MKQKQFIKGNRVRVIFHDKNNSAVPVGATGTVFEDSISPVIFVTMDDVKLNKHNTNAFNGNSPRAALLNTLELELESIPDDLEQTKQKILKYTDFWGGDISDVQTIKDAKNADDLHKILSDHEAFMEMQLADAMSHINNFRNSLPYLKDE